MKTTRIGSELTTVPRAGLDAPVPATEVKPPALRLPLDLPQDLRNWLLTFLVPASPFLAREGQPTPRFPVASTMRDLSAVSRTCKELYAMVANLRCGAGHAQAPVPAFELASRSEYEFRRRTEQARAACIARYNIDPEDSKCAPYRSVLHLLEAGHVEDVCQKLLEHRGQIRELLLVIGNKLEAPPGKQLQIGFSACIGLNSLELRSDGALPAWLADEVSAFPALQAMVVEAPSLASDFVCGIAHGALAPRLRSLNLIVPSLSNGELREFAAAARDLPALRYLTVSRATVDLDSCRALADALPNFAQLEGLSLGELNGRVSGEGARILVEALVAHGNLRRLGLRNLDAVSAVSASYGALRQYGKLEELAFGGELMQDALIYPWDLLEGSNLRSLTLDSCKFDRTQMEALAKAISGSTSLRELHIIGVDFSEGGARALAVAIRASKTLLALSLENCRFSMKQGHALGIAIGASSTLLVVRILLRRQGDAPPQALSSLTRQAKRSKTLLQFDVGAVRDGINDLRDALFQNRLR